MSVDGIILIQFIVFTGIIGRIDSDSGWLLGSLWAIYVGAMLLKIAFYIKFHPWGDVISDDFKKGIYFNGSIFNKDAIACEYEKGKLN